MPDDVAIVLNPVPVPIECRDLDGQSLIVDYLESHPQMRPAMKRQIALAVRSSIKDAASDDAGWDACDAMVETFVQASDPEGLVFRGEIERVEGGMRMRWSGLIVRLPCPGSVGTYINSMVDCLLELNRARRRLIDSVKWSIPILGRRHDDSAGPA